LFVGKRNGYKNFLNTLKAYSKTSLKNEAKLVCFGSSDFSIEESQIIKELPFN